MATMQLPRYRPQRVAKWATMVLCASWVLGAGLFVFLQPAPMANPYVSLDKQIAKCRTLGSSQARYDCTSKLMLAKDNATFDKAALVLLPPLVLLFGYYIATQVITSRRAKRKSQEALAASRRRMDDWRNHLREIKATAARRAGEAVLRAEERPSGTPTPLAKKP